MDNEKSDEPVSIIFFGRAPESETFPEQAPENKEGETGTEWSPVVSPAHHVVVVHVDLSPQVLRGCVL